MAREIPKRERTGLLRLISARADMEYAMEAFNQLRVSDDERARYSLFLAFVVSYCRPFTENSGIGSLGVEFPRYPEELKLQDAEIRHQRMMGLRNKFLSHSSLEGTKLVLLSPGAADPGTGKIVKSFTWNVAKLEFLDQRYAEWLVEIVDALKLKLSELIVSKLADIGPRYMDSEEARYIETAADDFRWT